MTNVVLVGPMGAGKSTVGKQLAVKLDHTFIDTDQLIESRAGADIPWIFDVEGEVGFRHRETAALESLCQLDHHVIATGGGIITEARNLPLLKTLGFVVYLTASLDQLFDRTKKDKKRPLLQVENPKIRISELFAKRDPIYQDVADFVLRTDGKTTRWAVNQIVKHLAQDH